MVWVLLVSVAAEGSDCSAPLKPACGAPAPARPEITGAAPESSTLSSVQGREPRVEIMPASRSVFVIAGGAAGWLTGCAVAAICAGLGAAWLPSRKYPAPPS